MFLKFSTTTKIPKFSNFLFLNIRIIFSALGPVWWVLSGCASALMDFEWFCTKLKHEIQIVNKTGILESRWVFVPAERFSRSVISWIEDLLNTFWTLDFSIRNFEISILLSGNSPPKTQEISSSKSRGVSLVKSPGLARGVWDRTLVSRFWEQFESKFRRLEYHQKLTANCILVSKIS